MGLDHRHMDFMPDSPLWFIYLSVFIGPFIQEDTAVLAAATLSANDVKPNYIMFGLVLAGLFLSDIWKYWIGWAATRNDRARAFAEKKHVAELKDKVLAHTGVTLLTIRFMPFGRIPTYVACGFFHVPYWKFCFYILLSGTIYVALIFASCHVVGEIMGERLAWIMPITVIVLLLIYIIHRYLKIRREERMEAVKALPVSNDGDV